MKYSTPLLTGTLKKRYKRFLADVSINGEILTVHCPNSGSMAGLTDMGNLVRISGPHHSNRKYLYTLEQIRVKRNDNKYVWVGVNTNMTNFIAKEAATLGNIPGFENYTSIQSEITFEKQSRIDLLLNNSNHERCWIEVKSVTLVQSDPTDKDSINDGNIACFPDAVTERGLKHLSSLIKCVNNGDRAVNLFVIQRNDAQKFAPAIAFDRVYAERLAQAETAGVEILAMKAKINKNGIMLLPCLLPIDLFV